MRGGRSLRMGRCGSRPISVAIDIGASLKRSHGRRLRRTLNAALAGGMPPAVRSTLKYGERPVIHSGSGCHYRWPEWIRICKERDLTLSMSVKGCSPDNAAAEGFFGRPRQEFFHKRSFAGITMDEFVDMLDDYMVWYRDKRIKTEFGRGHHGSSTRARSCGMIGGDGVNGESNKTAPSPAAENSFHTMDANLQKHSSEGSLFVEG